MVSNDTNKVIKYLKKKNGATIEEIEHDLIPKKKFYSVLFTLEKSGFINTTRVQEREDGSGNPIYDLSIDGDKYAESIEWHSKLLDKKQILPIDVSLLLFATVLLYFTPKFSSTVYPDLDYYVKDTETLSMQRLTTIAGSGEKVRLCIINKGQIPTGHIVMRIDYPQIDSIEELILRPKIWNFNSIPEKNSSCSVEYIRAYCSATNDECSQEEIDKIPTGEVKVNFEVKCPNCEIKKDYIKLDFCIWDKDSAVCPLF